MNRTFRFRALLALQAGLLGILTFVGTGAVQAQSGGGSGGAIFGVLIWLGVIVGVIVYMRNQRQPYQVETQTALTPEDALRTAIQTFTMNGWQVTSQTKENATFVRNIKGSCLIAAILLLIGIIPGILYLAFMGRSINANVFARANDPSRTTVQISTTATGFGGRATAERAVRALSAPAGYAPQAAGS